MMIMSVGRERQIRNDRAEMEHRRELNSELTGRMHSHAELKRFTNGSGFHARANAAPERCIEQHDINSSIQNIRCELFEVYDDGVGCEWYTDFLTHTAHSVHAKYGIFEIVVSDVFDLLSKPDR